MLKLFDSLAVWFGILRVEGINHNDRPHPDFLPHAHNLAIDKAGFDSRSRQPLND
jgi:hypothetical protein